MISSRTRQWYNPSKIFLLVFLLLGGAIVRSFGQCETNERPFQITKIQPTANGRIAITWAPTCTNFIFGVFSAEDLRATNTPWIGRSGVWGDASGTMSWTDTAAKVGSRFFKAVRILPTTNSDWDADGLPDIWEADYGLNPFDPGDAHADFDDDGVDSLAEYLQGRDPTRGAVADPGGMVKLQVFTPLE